MLKLPPLLKVALYLVFLIWVSLDLIITLVFHLPVYIIGSFFETIITTVSKLVHKLNS